MGRAEDKKKSLAALGRIAERANETPWVKPDPRPAPSAARPPPPSALPSPPPSLSDITAARARAKKLEERRLKLEEEKRLKARRANELQRGSSLEWRGMGMRDVPASIRRTAFDVVEPSVSQKISDVLGDAREKEGRAKAKDKGRRQRG